MAPPQPDQVDPNPPSWLLGVIINMQLQEDREFNDRESAYRQAAAGWIAYCITQHQTGSPVEPFRMALPSKQVFQALTQGSPSYSTQPFTSHTVFDPLLQPPVEPPNTVVKPPYHNPLGTGQTVADTNSQKILDLLQQIANKLGV